MTDDHKRLLELQRACDPSVSVARCKQFCVAAHAAVPELVRELSAEQQEHASCLSTIRTQQAELASLRAENAELAKGAAAHGNMLKALYDAHEERDALRAENAKLVALLDDYDIRPDV
jgi:septal ring factor EnvC (AmiA/AmiB activator)